MSFDISTLEPQIREILSAPGTDLQTISAKRVRKKLLELEPSLTPEVLKEHKAELDTVIATVFQSVSAAEVGRVEASEEPEPKRKWDDRRVKEEEIADEEEDDAPSPPPKKARKATKKELSDAELARQLSSQINGRTRRSGTANGSSPKKGTRKMKKSADFIESDSDEDEDAPKKKRKSGGRAKGGSAKGGFAKEYMLSPPLAAVLDFSQLSRPQVVKHLWEYIKGNQLQNPRNKREIMCDEGLRAVFGCDKIDMFRMNKVLGMHLHERDE